MTDKRKTNIKQKLISLLPIAALLVLFAAFLVVVSINGYRLDMYLKIVFNEALVLAVVATGAIFIYTLGTFDISLGASTLFAATMGVMTYNKTQSLILMIVAIFAVGITASLLNSVLASVFHIPPFVTTVAFGNIGFKAMLLIAFFAICFFVFQFTKAGRRMKFVGGNPICAELTGIKASKYTILAFVMAGIGIGLGAFLTLCYTPSVTTTTASSIGMNIFIAIVFGGMPISGGARSKIYAALIGGFSYILLNDILEIVIDSSAAYGITQVISAVFFLAVVYVTSMNYRTALLPR